MMILDQWWWFMIPGLILGLYAQFKFSSAYSRFSRVPNNRGLTGAEAAREVLDSAGLHQVEIHEISGHLNDHYDPTKRALFLCSENYHSQSVAAVGVAAHEAGHALQHAAAYAPLNLRMALVPITNIATSAVYGLWLLSLFLHLSKVAWIGVIIFGVITFFQLVTLPVEYDASRRAKAQLLGLGLVDNQERSGLNKVLNAAALTYVAAMVTSLMSLLHFAMIARGNDRD